MPTIVLAFRKGWTSRTSSRRFVFLPAIVFLVVGASLGNAQQGPVVLLSPTSLSFPQQPVGSSSQSQYVNVTNVGTAPLYISSVTTDNPGLYATPTCAPVDPISPSQICTIFIGLVLTTPGSFSGTVTITDNAADSPQKVPVSGSATAIDIEPTSLDFQMAAPGQTSAAQTLTITNRGSAAVKGRKVAITGTNANEFVIQSNNCPQTLQPAGTCAVSIVFSPSTLGHAQVHFALADNDPESPQTATLTADGSFVIFTPSPVDMGSVKVDTSAPPVSVKLTNTGTTDMNITGVVVRDITPPPPNPPQFYLFGEQCTGTLAAGASCTIQVFLGPDMTGKLTGAISVTDDAASSFF